MIGPYDLILIGGLVAGGTIAFPHLKNVAGTYFSNVATQNRKAELEQQARLAAIPQQIQHAQELMDLKHREEIAAQQQRTMLAEGRTQVLKTFLDKSVEEGVIDPNLMKKAIGPALPAPKAATAGVSNGTYYEEDEY